MRSFCFSLLFVLTFAVGGARAQNKPIPYAIPPGNIPDIGFADDADLLNLLQKAYWQVFTSKSGQAMLASFENCNEVFFKKHFQMTEEYAVKVKALCENLQKQKTSEVSANDGKPERLIDAPRRHYLKLIPFGGSPSSFTYMGNQTILNIPKDAVDNTETLSVLLLHETAIYLDAKNPWDFDGIIKKNHLSLESVSPDFKAFYLSWTNPFIMESLAVLRAYRAEQAAFESLSAKTRTYLFSDNPWYQRLNSVRDQKSCDVLLIDFISDVLLKDENYLQYRWISGIPAFTSYEGKNLSTAEILHVLKEDLEAFLNTNIKINNKTMSACEFGLLPDYSDKGIRFNQGPRPPIKPGAVAMTLESAQPSAKAPAKPFDIRKNWSFYQEKAQSSPKTSKFIYKGTGHEK